MSNIAEKLEKVIKLTPQENLEIFGPPKRSYGRVTVNAEEPIGRLRLSKSKFETSTIISLIQEAIKQMDFFLCQFPRHEKPPPHLFDYTLAAFLHRRSVDQWDYQFYENVNAGTLNMAKLNVDYKKCESVLSHLVEDLKTSRSYASLKQYIWEMVELDHFLINLDKENEKNAVVLRQRELQLMKFQSHLNQPAKEIRELDHEYSKVQNEYHDVQVIKARKLRYEKNFLKAEMDQVKWHESNKAGDLLAELENLSRSCENEIFVSRESLRFSHINLEDTRKKLNKLALKYDNDIINTDFEIMRARSELNYFEEMWESKLMLMDYMKTESNNYVESVRQRHREVIAKRLGKVWIASARKTIAQRKRKAKMLAKKKKEQMKKK